MDPNPTSFTGQPVLLGDAIFTAAIVTVPPAGILTVLAFLTAAGNRRARATALVVVPLLALVNLELGVNGLVDQTEPPTQPLQNWDVILAAVRITTATILIAVVVLSLLPQSNRYYHVVVRWPSNERLRRLTMAL